MESLTIAVEELEADELDLAGFDALLHDWIAADSSQSPGKELSRGASIQKKEISAGSLSGRLQRESTEELNAVFWTI